MRKERKTVLEPSLEFGKVSYLLLHWNSSLYYLAFKHYAVTFKMHIFWLISAIKCFLQPILKGETQILCPLNAAAHGCYEWNLKNVQVQRSNCSQDSRDTQKRCTLRFEIIFGKPYKNDEKCFLFHFQSSFPSQDIYIFVLIISSCRKTSWLET